MEDFIKEVQGMTDADIKLVLDDQQDLYSKEELEILKNELKSRYPTIDDLEKAKKAEKLEFLKSNGCKGYWEYKVISIIDNNDGSIYPLSLEKQMNSLGLDGWKLVIAYANEIGKNSKSGGIGGFSTGTNSTVDQNILIFQRFVKIQ